jgi:hypothetical protein
MTTLTLIIESVAVFAAGVALRAGLVLAMAVVLALPLSAVAAAIRGVKGLLHAPPPLAPAAPRSRG